MGFKPVASWQSENVFLGSFIIHFIIHLLYSLLYISVVFIFLPTFYRMVEFISSQYLGLFSLKAFYIELCSEFCHQINENYPFGK